MKKKNVKLAVLIAVVVMLKGDQPVNPPPLVEIKIYQK